MDRLSGNWVWLLAAFAFVATQLFGYGGRGDPPRRKR